MVFDSLIDDAVELWDGAFAVVLAVVLGCLVLYFVRSHHDLDGDLADEVSRQAEQQMRSLDAELAPAIESFERRLSQDPVPRHSMDNALASSSEDSIAPDGSALAADGVPADFGGPPPSLARFQSQDIKQAVNHVLMPRYLAHQSNISRLKKQHRAGEISRVEHRQAVVASANEFDVRYAVAVRAATALAEALPPEAEVIPLAELRRLTSVGDEELAMVEELQVEMHELSTRRTGISQSAT